MKPISALEEGDLRPDQVKLIAKRLGVTEQDVVDMNRRLGGDASLNAAIRGEWQDRLVDESADQETTLAASEEFDNRRKTLSDALTVLNEHRMERPTQMLRHLRPCPMSLKKGQCRKQVRKHSQTSRVLLWRLHH
jgi:RNA polymerase sigma-32 factor